MANEIGDVTTVTVPLVGTAGPGYATTINAAIEELQARVSQRADNGSIAQMPAGTVKANLTGALADAQDVTLAALSAALGGGGGGYPVIVEDIGVSTTNSGADNELALRTHMNASLGTPYSYQFGPGTYNFDKNALAGDPGRGSIYIKDTMAARRFFGQGRGVTTIAYGGLGDFGDWHCFYVVGGSSARFEVADLTVKCSGITNPDAADQNHLIQISATATHGSGVIRDNVRINNTNFGACIGAGFRTLGDTSIGNFVQGYALTDCDFDTSGIGTGSRSCLECQQGSRFGLYANVNAKGARNSVFDSEITSGTGYAQGLVFENCVFDNTLGSTHNVFSLGGSSTVGVYRVIDWVLSNVVTKTGYVGIFHCDNLKLLNCRFEYTVGLNAVIDALMNDVAGAVPLVTVRGENRLLELSACVWRRGPGILTPKALIDVEAFSGPTRRTFELALHNPTFIEQSTVPATAVVLAGDVDDLLVTNMRVLSGATSNFTVLSDCLRWTSVTAASCTRFRVEGLTVKAAGGLMNRLVYIAAGGGITLGQATLVDIDGVGILNAASASSCVVEFDTTTGVIYENPHLSGLRSAGQYTWIASSAAATAVFPVVGGNVGSRTQKTLESYTTPPNTFALGAPGDLFFYRSSPQLFELWIKRTQTSGAVMTQDRNGWVLLTSSTAGTAFSGAYTAVAGRGHDLQAMNFAVVDASVSPTSRISVHWAPTTSLDENTPDVSNVRFAAFSVGAGSFAIQVISNDNKPISGDYKLIYQVS